MSSRTYVADHGGLVGSALWRELEARGSDKVGRDANELDLRVKADVDAFIASTTPDTVIMAAARVGGILANSTYPADFIYDNLQMQLNLLNAAVENQTPRVLFLGSSSIYPKFAPQPIAENSLLTGPLEPSNDAYAIALVAGVLHVQAIRRQYGLPYISAMPTNLYGPGDNFDLQSSQVLPAMMRKMHEAKVGEKKYVDVWGTGTPLRDFLHVDDLAKACLFLLDHYDEPEPINVGSGEELTIRELAELVRHVVGFEGGLVWDKSKPDGPPRRLLDSRKINSLGWKPAIGLEDGIRSTYQWFLEHAGLDARQ